MHADIHSANPLVSVVMPVYRINPVFFRKAVRSIQAQSVKSWELIIVEDPSDQSIQGTVEEISDSRIRYIANSHRTSQLEQRNRTLEESDGQYIAFMDADDIAHPFRFAKQIQFFKNHPDVDVLGSQVVVIDEDDYIVGHRWYPVNHDDILCAAAQIVPTCQPTMMFRREVFDEFGGYTFTEFNCALEYDYWSRLLRAGVRFANFPEPLLYYRIHQQQIKYKNLREAISAVLRIKELYWTDQFSLSARLRFWAERSLLYMPTRVVNWFLLKHLWHCKARRSRILIDHPFEGLSPE